MAFTKGMKAFFKNFAKNAKTDPAATVKGVAQIVAAGGAVYGMATGILPVNETTVTATAAALVSGVHAVGSDTVTGR